MAGAARVEPAATSRAMGREAARALHRCCELEDRIAPEVVDWDDFGTRVERMIAAVRTLDHNDAASKMRARLQRMWPREYKRLATSARRIRAGSVSFEKRISP